MTAGPEASTTALRFSPAGRALPAGGSNARAKRSRKAFWLKQLHSWHWISSAISLVGLLLFAVTGITLNNAASIEATPVVAEREAELPSALRPLVAPDDRADDRVAPLPPAVAGWAGETFGIPARGDAEWSAAEVYLSLPRPGGDGWMAIDRETGAVTVEETDRGWIAYLNDLHKGRNAGGVWKWFIDIFSVACVIFAVTGLLLLKLHAARRPSTWPLVAAGLAIPALLAILFIH